MLRKVLFLVLVVGLSAGSAWAWVGSVTVENASFELPGQGKIKGWDGEGVGGTPAVDIPGWSSDTTPGDSGVETDWGPTDGLYTGFMMGSDPSTWNLTDHVIAAGDVFTLQVDARITGGATDILIALYYDDAGTRVEAASATKALTAAMVTYSLEFAADGLPGSIGNKIGIELDNPGGGWLGMDNVRLDVIPEPATMALLGLGGLALLRRKRS